MASMLSFSQSTWPSITRSPSARAHSISKRISSQPSPCPFRSERIRIAVFASLVIGVRVKPRLAHQLAGLPVERHERDGPRIVDLGQARDERHE